MPAIFGPDLVIAHLTVCWILTRTSPNTKSCRHASACFCLSNRVIEHLEKLRSAPLCLQTPPLAVCCRTLVRRTHQLIPSGRARHGRTTTNVPILGASRYHRWDRRSVGVWDRRSGNDGVGLGSPQRFGLGSWTPGMIPLVFRWCGEFLANRFSNGRLRLPRK